MHLFADRFLSQDDHRAIDLATGHTVTLHVSTMGGPTEQVRWAGRCAAIVDREVQVLAPLVDFGVVGEGRRFEAWRCDGAPQQSPRPALDGIVREDLLDVVIDRSPGALAIAELLADSRRREPCAVSAWGSSDASVSRVAVAIARSARREGYVPVCVEMWERWHKAVAGRTLCLIVCGELAVGWRAFLEAALEQPNPHVVVFLGNQHVRGVPMVNIDAGSGQAFGPIVAAARDAKRIGSEPREPRRARSRAAEARSEYLAHPVAAVVSHRAGGEAVWPATAELVALRRQMRTAVETIARGRHAVGERELRQAIGKLSRRRDLAQAALGALDLARAHLSRGRTDEASAALAEARVLSSTLERHDLLIQIAVLSSCAAVDDVRFDVAESQARSALLAADGLGECEGYECATVALARCLFWQGRYETAASLLDRPRPAPASRMAIRLAIERSRAAVGLGDLPRAMREALDAVDRAGHDAADLRGRALCAVAFAHLAVGDWLAVQADVRQITAAARAARDPLLAIRAHLLDAEAARRRGHAAPAARLVQRLQRLQRLPALLAARMRLLGALLAGGEDGARACRQARLRIPALSLYAVDPRSSAAAASTRHVIDLLECCQSAESDGDLLRGLCARVRTALGAAGVALVACPPGEAAPLAAEGTRVDSSIAVRVAALGQPILPHADGGPIEGGAPVRYGGHLVGVLVAKWTIGAMRDARAAGALLATAAVAAAPSMAAMVAARRASRDRTWPDLIGVSDAMHAVRQAIERTASAPFAVLIEGESGSGKELVARGLRQCGSRSDRPWAVVNCAAIPDDLVESEFFGHARGAFTGALAERIGVFETAHTGTLFLDEVGELSLRAQAKLLRTIQEGEIKRVGESVARRVDVRLIAATNRNLRHEVEEGRFRHDLLYRLDVVRIAIPSLRERRDDIPLLVDRFWREATARIESRATLGLPVVHALTRYDWPGNVRELQNVLAALAVRAPRRGVVPLTALPPHLSGSGVIRGERLDEARRAFEEAFVRDALARAGGQRTRAAAALGLTRQGLTKLMSRLGLGGPP